MLGSHVITADTVAAQPAPGSPSDAVAVTVTGPGTVQVNVGLADVELLKVPEGAVQE